MQIERGVDASYLLDEIKYCNIDEPDATDLRMGISPGWVDIYEASITFQWVDTPNTLPGRYWVGSAIDPNDEIRESNEDNNGIVFSTNKYAVSPYNARVLPAQAPGEITLKSTVFGTVGQVAYVIVDPPEHGSLSVPAGVDLLTSTVEYRPDFDYQGTDSFSYYAHDTNTPFPFDPFVVVVDIEVDTTTEPPTTKSDLASPDAAIAAPNDEVVATRYDRISISITINDVAGEASLRWYAKDLPAGLTIDPASGQIDGELLMPGNATSTIVARVDGNDIETTIAWTVADAPRASLRPINDFSTVLGRRDILVGAGTAETTYRSTGLPDGSVLTAGQPSILGVPTEIGDFEIVVEELRDGQVVDTVNFTMTVRPAAKPKFVL
jgi:hypothetical protein